MLVAGAAGRRRSLVPALRGRARPARGRRQAPARAALGDRAGRGRPAARPSSPSTAARTTGPRASPRRDARLLRIQRRDALVAGLADRARRPDRRRRARRRRRASASARPSTRRAGRHPAGGASSSSRSAASRRSTPLPDAAQRLDACARRGRAPRGRSPTRPSPSATRPRPAAPGDGRRSWPTRCRVRFADRDAPGARRRRRCGVAAGRARRDRRAQRRGQDDARPAARALPRPGRRRGRRSAALDVRARDAVDLRQAVRLASQDAHLFTTTIRQNVAARPPGGRRRRRSSRRSRAPGSRDWLAGAARRARHRGRRGRRRGLRRSAAAHRARAARSSPTRASSCSTSRPPTSTRAGRARPARARSATDREDPRGVLVDLAHASTASRPSTRSSCSTAGRIAERGAHADAARRRGRVQRARRRRLTAIPSPRPPTQRAPLTRGASVRRAPGSGG